MQAQVFQLTDRTRLRRLKDTLQAKGAWQQVVGIEDLCDTRVSHKWLNRLDACVGSVLTLHDNVVTFHKRVKNRSYTGDNGSLYGTYYLAAFDAATGKIGAERYRQQREVLLYVPDLDNVDPESRVAEVRALATVGAR